MLTIEYASLFINLLYMYSLAPSSPPIDITISVINSTAIHSTWRIPDEDEHNGLLESVEVRLVGIDIETSITIPVQITTNDTSLQTTILSPLQEYVNYSIRLAIRNGAGLSPYSNPVYLRTDQAGKFLIIIDHDGLPLMCIYMSQFFI